MLINTPSIGDIYKQKSHGYYYRIIGDKNGFWALEAFAVLPGHRPKRQRLGLTLQRTTKELENSAYWEYVPQYTGTVTTRQPAPPAPAPPAPAAVTPATLPNPLNPASWKCGQVWKSPAGSFWKVVAIVPKGSYSAITLNRIDGSGRQTRSTTGLGKWEFVPDYVGADSPELDVEIDLDVDKARMNDFVPDRDKLKNYFLNKKKLGG